MPALGDLPPEMVLEILDNLPRRDQAAFTRASKWTNAIMDRYMYQRNKSHENSSAIQDAVEKANIPALQKALFYGLDPNRREPWTRGAPLHQAVRSGPDYPPSQETTREIIQILLKAGADQRLKDDEHRTPFEVACIEGNHGASLALLDSEYSKVVLNQRAVNRTLHQVVEPLGNYTCSVSRGSAFPRKTKKKLSVYWANQRELLRRIRSMPGVNVNSRRNHVYQVRPQHGVKVTPLHAALAPGSANGRGLIMPDIGIVKMLLEAGARPNATSPNTSYNNALNMVVKSLAHGCWCAVNPTPDEVVDFVKLLISHGARPDAGGKDVCPFRRALVLATLTNSVIRGRAKGRLNAVVKAMLEAKQLGNPTKWLLKRCLVDEIIGAALRDYSAKE